MLKYAIFGAMIAIAGAVARGQDYQVISKGGSAGSYSAFPDVCRLKNGDLLAVFYTGYGHVSVPATADYPNGGRICMVRSTDDGRTWSAPAVLFDDPDDNRDPHIAQLADGTVVCSFFSFALTTGPLKTSADFSWKTWPKMMRLVGAEVAFSHDGGHTWDKAATSVAAQWACSAPVRQLKNGTCLLGIYREENQGERKFDHAWGGVALSHDSGRTWPQIVPIGKQANLPLDAETDVIQLQDGRLFAALRSSKIHMRYATSADDGQTWSKVADIGFDAQCPHLLRLSTGEIILSHRKPKTDIHLSRDDAQTWSGPYEIDNCIGAYPSCVELDDGSVLIVYYTEGQGSEIRAKRFRVKPDGIEILPMAGR